MNRTAATLATAGLALASIASLTGCGGSGATASAATFPNPVDIITAAKCTPDAGVTQGSAGLDGTFMVADCTYPSATSMRVMTFKTNADRDSHLAAFPPQDGQTVIVGEKFFIDLLAPAGQPSGYDPAPSMVQLATGGTIR